MKKYLRRIARPLPFVVLVASTLAALFIQRDYFLPLAVVLGAHLLVETVDFFTDSQIKRRKGPDAVRDNMIELYVDDVVYERLHQMADECDMPFGTFCRICLERVDPSEDLELVKTSYQWEVNHGK